MNTSMPQPMTTSSRHVWLLAGLAGISLLLIYLPRRRPQWLKKWWGNPKNSAGNGFETDYVAKSLESA